MYKFSALVVLVFVLTGCQSLNAPEVRLVLTDLQQQGLCFTPSSPFITPMTAAFPPDLWPAPAISYDRRESQTGTYIDAVSFYSLSSRLPVQQVEERLQTYADDPYGLRGVNLGGPLEYYRCGTVFAVYQPSWQSGFDPAVEQIFTDRCGPAFIRFPAGDATTPLAEWPIYRHPALGFELRYPPNWQPCDYTSVFVRFCDPQRGAYADELFDIVNAPFQPLRGPIDFLRYMGPPVIWSKIIVIDRQPALFMQLNGDATAGGYQSVVGLIRPDGHTLTVGNRGVEPALFAQILSTIRYGKVVNPPG